MKGWIWNSHIQGVPQIYKLKWSYEKYDLPTIENILNKRTFFFRACVMVFLPVEVSFFFVKNILTNKQTKHNL